MDIPLSDTPLDALLRCIERHAPSDGVFPSPLPGLTFFRAGAPSACTPVVYPPSICIVAQGRKRARLAGDHFDYDPLHYLVLSVALPARSEIVEASLEAPFLSLKIDIDAAALADLVAEIGATTPAPPGERAARGIFASPMSRRMLDAVVRLVDALDHPEDRAVLAPMALREVMYHVLTGEQGERLRAAALRDSRAQRVASVVRFMENRFDQPLDIATIADHAHMSPSTLHHNFKAVTSVSPLQYLKLVRLHRARVLMLRDGIGAADAAHRVGYVSPSQFSREFKRLFGASPTAEVERLRGEGVDAGLMQRSFWPDRSAAGTPL